MKQLLRYTTSTLFRTALLLGVLALINIPTQAQTAAQWAEMPDAFETMDPASIIGDGNYYYIQFYQSTHIQCSYLTDCGVINGVSQKAMTKDFLPYANNRLWTLVRVYDNDNTKFKLRSKVGNYLSFGFYGSQKRVICVNSPENASILQVNSLGTGVGDGYDISTVDEPDYPMFRNGVTVDNKFIPNEWDELPYNVNRRGGYSDATRLRFAKLKSNAAFIIYYRGEGTDNADPAVATTRHYLTYSGTDYGLTSLIDNGDMEGNDASCFQPSTITNGIGTNNSRGISVWSSGNEEYDHNTQFFIKAKSIIPIGKTVRVEFDYKADANVEGIPTQAQANPGQYNHYDAVGSINFTTNWQHFAKEITVTSEMGGSNNNFQTIAFNLGKKAATNFYFDNIVFTILEDTEVSSRRSIIPSNKPLCTLPTLAAYHQDGLWSLEDAGSDGQFYIKKYGTEEYLNAVQGSVSSLGTKNEVYGKYTLTDPDNNRYTLVKNIKYQTTSVADIVFYNWNSHDGSAGHTSETPATVENHVGQALQGGKTVVGLQNDAVDYHIYANLADYTKMVIEGTSGMQLRVLMNRQTASDPFVGVEKNVTIGSDGTAVVDLTDLTLNTTATSSATVKMTYVDADNAATSQGEISWGNSAKSGYNKITNGAVTLANTGWAVNYLTYLQVDASAIPGRISKVTLKAKVSGSTDNKRTTGWGVGYNNSDWSSSLTWNTADKSITTIGAETWTTTKSSTTFEEKTFDITQAFTSDADKIVTILVYELAAAGGYIKEPEVVVEYYPSVAYTHLNAIKTGWGDAGAGTVTSISLVNQNSQTTGNPTCLNHSNGDGWPVLQRSGYDDNYWYAGFYPVEVPVPNKDDFFQVLVRWGNNMINHNGGVTEPCPSNEADYDLWQLEMVDDYLHFRLKAPNGGYLKPGGSGVTAPNDPTDAEILTNAKFFNETLNDFSLTWIYVNPMTVSKEIPVKKGENDLYMVTHKMSYLKQYAQAGLDKQGLATDKDSDWKNEDQTQKTNHFEITHYVKKGNTITVEFPTVLNKNNDHIYYQRFYNYDETDASMNLDNLKAHVSLDTRDDGDVQYFLYKNGMVTGQKLDWTYNDGTDIPDGGMARNALRRFNFTNSDGNAFTVAADVSRYSDIRYWNTTAHLDGDLEEPSLTMRYIYYMYDAKDIARELTGYPEQTGVADAAAWKETGTVCIDDNLWKETKEFHFPAKSVAYENNKWVGYRGEFIGLKHVFSDYWVFNDGNANSTDDNNLVWAVDNAYGGKIEVRIYDPNDTGIRLGGYNPNINLKGTTEGVDADYQGFYFYDKMANKNSYGDSRFVVFRYPSSGTVTNTGKKAYIHVYFNNGGTRYQLAQFTVIFDENSDTRPWKFVNGSAQVKDSNRDPAKLRELAGRPIAKVTFDYPLGNTYHTPDKGQTKQGWVVLGPNSTLANSSPVPLNFDNTNYAFNGFECNWGSYAIVSQMTTNYGNHQNASPANHASLGYNIGPDAGLQSGFLYIDASEQPGNICSAEFQGEFCASDKLMCSGWISGSNKVGGADYRCPGGITLTVKGERIEDGQKETIYRFCPGQCYELDNGSGVPDGSGLDGEEWLKNAEGKYIDSDGNEVDEEHRVKNPNYDNFKYDVVWQQFYFEFGTTKKYKRYWLEVNNNCVSSNGGDFMLDNVEVFALVPEVIPEMNTPICVHKDASEMQLLKMNIGFDKILAAYNNSHEVTGDGVGEKKDISFVFLKKDLFLATFLEELNKEPLNFGIANVEELEDNIERGVYENLITTNSDYKNAYKTAFDVAILGDKTKIWDSDSYTDNLTAAVLNYHWSTKFSEMETYSFAKAVNGSGSVFRETDSDSGERFIVINGNYPNKLPWKADTEYYVVPYTGVATLTNLYEDFNICSACCKKAEFKIDPPIQILSMEASDVTEELVVCEGKIPTLVTNLKGYNINGELVPMKGLNFDWWLGSETTLATLDNYHQQENTAKTARLDEALYILRIYYPEVTSLDGVVPRSKTNTTQTAYHQSRNDPELTQDMIDYLKGLVDAGQLILHQKSISIPAEKVSDEDPYFYLVACPIHDGYFEKALNPAANEYVAYFCDEPQGFRIKVGEKAPSLKCGFVPYENGFSNYDYSTVNDAVLSIRLAKKEQFEEVQHGETTDSPATTYNIDATTDKHFLWLPIRNAEVESPGSTGVLRKSDDYDIYLASTDDPTWDQNIYTAMSQTIPKLPIVGKIVQLNAIDTKVNSSADQTSNRLCIYFTSNFEVREGYNYTLSLPFKEEGDGNACDGNILLNLKIVPDYEVWTGGAGNTDWNNDQNWRRADGNTSPRWNANDELYVGAAGENSPLKGYKTNDWNYRTDNDRVLRKGFAPLYCTHVLMKSDEWGNAPELYDALDGAGSFSASPFPNLRDTSTPILKFDMQARLWDIWEDTYGENSRVSGKGRSGDLLAEMYQINTCDEIAFQPATELRNAHLLNYNNAWVEYQLEMKRWYLLGSPLQGTIAGEWYAPTGTAQQKTTYYDDVTFGDGYDRYSPAIFQRSWDKAKAVLYEVGSRYNTGDNPNDLQLEEESLPGSTQQGRWGVDANQNAVWNITGADVYLDRLGYKPMSGNKANVAMKGVWSNTYNDATVDYTKGGFSVMVLNNLKGGSNTNPAIVRLPKEDIIYDYYRISETGANDGGTVTDLTSVQNVLNRAKNRGRLKTDLLLPESTQKLEKEASSYKYGDRRTYTRVPIKEADLTTMIAGIRNHQEPVSAGISNMGYYLVENPFPCGMNMDQFFEANTGLVKKYWLLTADGQHLVQKAASGDWIEQDGNNFVTANAVVTPGQGFFVQATTAGDATTITFNKAMQAQSRYGVKDYNNGTDYTIVVGTKQKMTTKTETVTTDSGTEQVTIEVPEVDSDGNYVIEDITENVTVYSYVQTTETDKQYALKARTRSGEKDSPLGLVITAQRGDSQSSALVMLREGASNDFLPEEDTETFISSEDLKNVPMVYTLCGRLATTINSIHDFSCLPLGVESASDAPCTLTFHGVEMLGDSIAFYDAVEQKLTPLKSGMQFAVSGQTQNRYYLVRSLDQKEAAEETHIQIFTKGLVATVIASTAEPITNVRCFDTAGRLVYSASPQMAEYSFNLPAAGIYIIEAQTEADHKTKKVMTK